jgi:hypothetical protein
MLPGWGVSMWFASLLAWLEATQMATAVREGALLFPLIESIHVVASCVVFGSIAIVDLRLLAVTSQDVEASDLMAAVLPCTWVAFAFAAVTGALLFASNANAYAHNVYFLAKLVLIGAAGLNMLVFHFVTGPRAAVGSSASGAAWPVRMAGGTSLLIWTAVVASGRWIGFTMGNT